MAINNSSNINNSARMGAAIGVGATIALAVLSLVALLEGATKVVIIGWVAFVAMALGGWLGVRADATNPTGLVWGYGLASGAMVTSAAMFLLPQAMGLGGQAGSPRLGGIGVALGIVIGYSGHVVGHRLTHLDLPFDVTTAEISAHALSAGLIIGLVYSTAMPAVGILLGLAIVSHKGPAGYAAARRLRRGDKPVVGLLLPAAGVGVTAIPVALLPIPASPTISAVVFGFAAGIFLHVAMDFLPNCEAGSEIDHVVSQSEESHHHLDKLRTHAVGSTSIGAVAVVAAWLLI